MQLISVIIPAYNSAAFVKEAVDSALQQSYSSREVIVVDDGSTDGTFQLLEEYGDKVRVVRQSNRGRAAANNAGVSAAQGEWIAFLDADDIWLPDKLARQMELCGNNSISHTNITYFGDCLNGELQRADHGRLLAGRVLQELLVENFIAKSSVLMRRDLFWKYGGFDETYECVIDWPLWLKICARNELGYLPESLVRYRLHGKSVSMNGRKAMPVHLRVIAEAFGPGGVGQSLPQLRKNALASSYQINCRFAAESGDWSFAVRCALMALRHDVSVPRFWKNLVKAALIPFGVEY